MRPRRWRRRAERRKCGFRCHRDAPLPWFLIGLKTSKRFTSMRPPVAAEAPRPAAGYRRTEFWGWRPFGRHGERHRIVSQCGRLRALKSREERAASDTLDAAVCRPSARKTMTRGIAHDPRAARRRCEDQRGGTQRRVQRSRDWAALVGRRGFL